MHRILVTVPVTEKEKAQLQAVSADCRFCYAESPDRAQVQWADILFGNVPAPLLQGHSGLCWLQTNSAGVEPYLAPGLLPRDCGLTNATGAYGPAISEHLLAMHLALLKKLPGYRDAQQKGDWCDLGPVCSVRGSVVLVLGLGDIGGEYAKLCKALGAYVIGVRRTDLRLPDYADEIHLIDDLDSLLPRADTVAIALPGTPATAGLIDRVRLGKMKKGALLLNVGRGTIVEQEALCDALESGALAGAGLDVTDPEPLPAEHRLWKIPTALITPHVSGGYHLDETRRRIVGIFEENLRRFLKGEALNNRVDFATGYRKLEGER